MAADFRLSGQLEITGINFGPHLNNLRRQLAELKLDKNLAEASRATAAGFDKTTASAKKTRAEIFAATNNLSDFSDKAALALRRFTAFSLAAGATFGSLRLIFGGLKDAAKFQRELVKVQQVSNASAKEIAGLRNEISRLGQAFAAPAQELAEVSSTLSQAGYSIREVQKLLQTLSLTRLAATFGTVQQTTEGVIALTGQFGLKIKDVEKALSSINSVAAAYAVESGDLIEAVKRTGGVFAALRGDVSDAGQAIGEFNALVTSVRQTTRLPAETIATGIRTILARLERPQTIQYFRNLGIELTDLQGKFLGPYQALQKIGQAIDGLDTKDVRFAALAEVAGGTRQLGVLIPLLTQWRLQNEILKTSLEGTTSLLKDAQLPLGTISEKINQLSAAWSELSRNVFESQTFQFLAKEAINFAGSLVRVADSIAPLIPLFTILGGIKLGSAIARSGAIGALTHRLGTGHPKVGFASGGYIPGSGSGDRVPILAEPGEFVIKKSAARKLGAATLHALNDDIPRYADGGFTPGGISNREFYDIRKEFKKLSESMRMSHEAFDALAKEVRQTATNTAEARKLFKGGFQQPTPNGPLYSPLIQARSNVQPRKTATEYLANLKNAPSLENDILPPYKAYKQPLLTYANNALPDLGPLPSAPHYVPPLPPRGKVIGRVGNRTYRRVPRVNLQDIDTLNTQLSDKPVLVNESLENLTNPAHQMAVGLGGFRALDSNVPKTLTNEDLDYRLRDKAFVGGGATFGGATYGQASRKTLEYNAKLRLGRHHLGKDDFRTTLLPGESILGDLRSINENGLSAAREYLGGVGGRLKERFDPVKVRLARTTRHAVRRTQIAGIRSARAVGQSINNADPLTLAALAAGVEYGGDQLGFARTTTAPISGALGGASAGKALLGGKYGAGIGAAIGGATAFSQSQRNARLEQPTKDLEKNTDDLNDAFEDLKKGLDGSAERVDRLLAKQEQLQAGVDAAGKSSFVDKAKSVGVGAASFLPFLPKSLLSKAGTGALGLGKQAAGIIAANPLVAAGTAAAVGTYFGGRAVNRAFRGYGNEDLGFVKNLTLGAPQKGQTIGGDLAYKLLEKDAGITAETKQKALGQKDVAAQAREGITGLIKSGKGKQVSDALILKALGDDASIQQGFANVSGVGSTEAQRKKNLEAAQRNQINLYREKNINPALAGQANAEKLAKALDLSFKAADLFANKLDIASSLLGVFGANLEQSKAQIDDAFNVANGNFSANRTLSNPFDNIAGLNKGQISNQISSIEGFLGTNLNDSLKANLTSVPTLERLPEIINNELATAKQNGYDTTSNVGGFIGGLLQKNTGPLGSLPAALKKDLSSTFTNLNNEDATAYLSGDTNNRHTQAINESINQSKSKSVDFAKGLQDQINNFLKVMDEATNQRAGLLSSQTRLGANYSGAQAEFIANQRTLNQEAVDPLVQRQLELNPIRQLSGLQDPTASNIGENINRLMAERNKILNDGNVSESERISKLSAVNSQLDTNKEALDKLANSSIGLAAIQEKLQSLEARKSSVSDSIISDALGGNALENKKADLAYKLYQQETDKGRNGLISVAGRGLSKDDLQRGIQREQTAIEQEQGSEAAKKFRDNLASQLNEQSSGFTQDPERAKRNAATLKKINAEEGDLRAAGKDAGKQQLDAIAEQRKLLGENIDKFDQTVTSKFVAGISQLAEIAKSLNIPSTVSVQANHVHQFQFTGLDLQNLTPYFKQVAEEAINKALSLTTDGKVKQGAAPTPTPTQYGGGKSKRY